jgi:hypothetical protein
MEWEPHWPRLRRVKNHWTTMTDSDGGGGPVGAWPTPQLLEKKNYDNFISRKLVRKQILVPHNLATRKSIHFLAHNVPFRHLVEQCMCFIQEVHFLCHLSPIRFLSLHQRAVFELLAHHRSLSSGSWQSNAVTIKVMLALPIWTLSIKSAFEAASEK